MWKILGLFILTFVSHAAEAETYPHEGNMVTPVVEEVTLPDKGEEFTEGMKPVIVGIEEIEERFIGDKVFLTCRFIVILKPLERGEGIIVEGDSFAEVEFMGNLYEPEGVKEFVTPDGCGFYDEIEFDYGDLVKGSPPKSCDILAICRIL